MTRRERDILTGFAVALAALSFLYARSDAERLRREVRGIAPAPRGSQRWFEDKLLDLAIDKATGG